MAPSIINHAAPVTPTAASRAPAATVVLDAKTLHDVLSKKTKFTQDLARLHSKVASCLSDVALLQWRVEAIEKRTPAGIDSYHALVVCFVANADELARQLATLEMRAADTCQAARVVQFLGFPVKVAQLQVQAAALQLQYANLELALTKLEASAKASRRQ